jgi:hypothetical protein
MTIGRTLVPPESKLARDALLGTEETEAEENMCTDLRDTKKCQANQTS